MIEDRFKFRGMTLGGEWVYGNLSIISEKIKSCGMTIDAGYYISNKVGMPFAYPVRPETVGQCTGLKDKNGKLIYENDIVEFYAQSFLDALSRKDLQRRVGKVVWNDEELKFDVVVGNETVPNLCRETDDNQFVIIGNIHENEVQDV